MDSPYHAQAHDRFRRNDIQWSDFHHIGYGHANTGNSYKKCSHKENPVKRVVVGRIKICACEIIVNELS
jgi:hypothetical protein